MHCREDDAGDADCARGTGRHDGTAGQGAGEPHTGHNLLDVWNVPHCAVQMT